MVSADKKRDQKSFTDADLLRDLICNIPTALLRAIFEAKKRRQYILNLPMYSNMLKILPELLGS